MTGCLPIYEYILNNLHLTQKVIHNLYSISCLIVHCHINVLYPEAIRPINTCMYNLSLITDACPTSDYLMLSYYIMHIYLCVHRLVNPYRIFSKLIISNQNIVSFLLLKIHGMSLDVVPLFVHKLAQQCRDVLVTDKFLYVTDINGKNLSVVSCQLSESRIGGESVSNFQLMFSYLFVFKH